MRKNTICTLLFSLIVFASFSYNCSTVKGKTEPMEEIVEISTSFGSMYIWLYKETPLHRENFLKLAKSGFYDSTTFHRCIKNFMIQGGDPNTKDADPQNIGSGGPGYTVPAEIKDSFRHVRGALAAARQGDQVNPTRASSGSQFYICVSTEGTAPLNGAYTVYGMVIKGIEVADAIVSQPTSGRPYDRPLNDIRMTVKVLSKTKEQIKGEYGFDLN